MNRRRRATQTGDRQNSSPLPITARDRIQALNYGLGEPQEKYVPNIPRGSGCGRYIGFFFALFVGIGMTAGAVEAWLSQSSHVDFAGFLFLLSIGLLMLFCALVYSPLWPGLTSTSLICANGLIHRKPLAFTNRELAIRWDQVNAYYTDGLRLKLIVRDTTGAPGRKGVMIGAGQSAILDKINAIMIPPAVARFERGEQLAFGSFAVSQNGVQYKEHHFQWEQIARCTLMAGLTSRVVLLDKDGHRLASHNSFQIPNVFVLIVAVDTTLEQR